MANNNNDILSPLVQNIQAELQSDRQLQGIEISSSLQQPQQIQSDITNHEQLQIVFNPPRGEISTELNSFTLDSSISTKQNNLQVEFTPSVINIESSLAAQVIHAFSPIVDIQATQDGYLLTITDKRGTTTALIPVVSQENINNFINNYFENNIDIQELLSTHNESQEAHQYIQQLISDAVSNFENSLNNIRQNIEDVANYDLYIETPNGTNIWGGNIQLNARLFKNNIDVTDKYDASCFIWTRISRDHDADMYWNSNHAVGAKTITITGNDVRMNAVFQCKFEYGNVTVVAD